jgi:hypothetical protein
MVAHLQSRQRVLLDHQNRGAARADAADDIERLLDDVRC